MICLAIGLGVLGAVAFHKARRCRGGYYGHYGHGGYHYGWWGGPPWAHRHHGGFGRRGLYMALSHLDATPAQERAIVAEVDRLKERLHAAKAGARDARGDLAAAVRSPVLDDKQREQLADFLDRGGFGWRRGPSGPGGGPYRV